MQFPLLSSDSLRIIATRYRRSEGGLFPRTEEKALQSLDENLHMAWAVVCDVRHNVHYITPGAEELKTFIRSAAKPFQAFPLLDGDLPATLTPEDLAIACASHTGSARHIGQVEALLEKAGLDASALQCGADRPIDREMRKNLQKEGLSSSERIYNNCSGKHAGMLLCCRRHNWDLQSYLSLSHPLQQHILENIRHWSAVDDIPVAVDGCGAPVFYLPLTAMARLYAILGSESTFSPLRQAMLTHPDLIGGEGRVDTVIMQASRGALLAKVGADGVLCVSHLWQQRGLAIKIADGSASVRNMTLVHLLRALGWLDDTAWSDPRLRPHRENRRLNTLGQAIGDYRIEGLPETPLT